jgi:hypothetical protein
MIGRLMSLTLLTLIVILAIYAMLKGLWQPSVEGTERYSIRLERLWRYTNLEVLDLERCEANNGHG